LFQTLKLDALPLSKLFSRPASEFVQEEVLYIEPGVSVQEAAWKMKSMGGDSVIVAEGGRPLGIITERDLCYRVLAEGLDPRKTKVSEVMSKPLITMEKGRSLGEALALMASKNTRRLVLVEADGSVFGIVTRWGFTGDTARSAIPLPVNYGRGGMICPFCGAEVDGAKALSKHIDTVHIGAELTGGHVSIWMGRDRVEAKK